MDRSTQPAPALEVDPDRERVVLPKSPIDHWESSQPPVLAAQQLALSIDALARKAQRTRWPEQPRILTQSDDSTRYGSPFLAPKKPAANFVIPARTPYATLAKQTGKRLLRYRWAPMNESSWPDSALPHTLRCPV